jgi:hypothetical protein
MALRECGEPDVVQPAGVFPMVIGFAMRSSVE